MNHPELDHGKAGLEHAVARLETELETERNRLRELTREHASVRARLERARIAETFPRISNEAHLAHERGSFRVVHCSPPVTAILETSPDLLAADPWAWTASIPEDDRERVRKEMSSFLVGTGSDLVLEYRIVRPGGVTAWIRDTVLVPEVDGDGSEYVYRVVCDVTQERLLKDAEARFRGFINAMPDLFFRLDAQGRFRDCVNPGELPLLTGSETAVIGLTLDDLLPPGLAKMSKRAIDAVLRDGSQLEAFEYELPFDDDTRTYEARFCPEGADVCILVRDITESKRVTSAVLEACEGERRRIGADLHDGVSQQLAALSFCAHAVEQQISDERLTEEVRRLREGIENVAREARTLAHSFHPVEVKSLGLGPALEDLGRDLGRIYGIRCEVGVHGPEICELEVAGQVYRIVQEAISNAVRHGGARSVRVELRREESAVELSVEDDGCGIDQTDDQARGIGLQTMKHRAQRLGGLLHLESTEVGGARLVARFLIRSSQTMGER